MNKQYAYFEMLCRKIGFELNPAAVAYLYEAGRLIARKKGKTDLKDMTELECRIRREFPPEPIQWSERTHAENHQI